MSVTPRGQLEELLTATQKHWLKIMDSFGMDSADRVILIHQMLAYFSAAWYLKALMEVDPEEAARACESLQRIFDDGGEVGEWTWDLLSGLGVDPKTIHSAEAGPR